jgi:hypothetical protein
MTVGETAMAITPSMRHPVTSGSAMTRTVRRAHVAV